MRWLDVSEALSGLPVILLPIGTVKQNGPHLPIDADTIRIERVVGHAVAFVNEYDRLTKDAEWAKPVPSRHLVGVTAAE